ncbi:unnamed protein product [Amoebophrya sp. A25]|nr:unnamed protein product [Amoebophrya sp. A25]|eukprot:GSA25T00014995001.1
MFEGISPVASLKVKLLSFLTEKPMERLKRLVDTVTESAFRPRGVAMRPDGIAAWKVALNGELGEVHAELGHYFSTDSTTTAYAGRSSLFMDAWPLIPLRPSVFTGMDLLLKGLGWARGEPARRRVTHPSGARGSKHSYQDDITTPSALARLLVERYKQRMKEGIKVAAFFFNGPAWTADWSKGRLLPTSKKSFVYGYGVVRKEIAAVRELSKEHGIPLREDGDWPLELTEWDHHEDVHLLRREDQEHISASASTSEHASSGSYAAGVSEESPLKMLQDGLQLIFPSQKLFRKFADVDEEKERSEKRGYYVIVMEGDHWVGYSEVMKYDSANDGPVLRAYRMQDLTKEDAQKLAKQLAKNMLFAVLLSTPVRQ